MRAELALTRQLLESLLRNIELQAAMKRTGLSAEVFHGAARTMTINDFLENPPSDVRGAYALGLSKAGPMKGIYFHISKALGLVEWPAAYKEIFGKRWVRGIDDPDVTSEFLDRVVARAHSIVFFIPDAQTRAERQYTAEEVQYFITYPAQLARVTFVLGTYDAVDADEYDKATANKSKKQRHALAADVVTNARKYRESTELKLARKLTRGSK